MAEEKETPKAVSVKTETDQNIKTVSAIAYIIFFIPLLTNRESKFAMYHANQGLLLLITIVVLNFVVGLFGTMLFFIGALLLWWVPGVVGLVLGIIGIMNALNGEMKPLPVIGTIATLLK